MGRTGEPERDRAEGVFPRRGSGRWSFAATAAGFLVSFLAAGAVGLAGLAMPSPRLRQPIAFDHRLHAKENGIECTTCHAFFGVETFSGLPAADTCAACHAEAIGQTAEEARLVSLLRAGEPLAWRPLFSEPRHVFFTHRRHVAVARIGCEACHGAFAEARAPPERVRRLRMQDCLGCHRQAGAAVDCTVCHR